MNLSFHRLAGLELCRAFNWYEHRSKVAAERFRLALADTLERIAENPKRWPRFRSRYRWIKVRRFPYLIYFHTNLAGDIFIMAVAHGSRRPGYWLRRKI